MTEGAELKREMTTKEPRASRLVTVTLRLVTFKSLPWVSSTAVYHSPFTTSRCLASPVIDISYHALFIIHRLYGSQHPIIPSPAHSHHQHHAILQ
jgi:hypothetical protein